MQRLHRHASSVDAGVFWHLKRRAATGRPPLPLRQSQCCRYVSDVTDKPAHRTGTQSPGPNEERTDDSPFRFLTGYALFAKRPSRPFPPPFLSLPSGSFSDPLSTHNRSVDRRQQFEGEVIRGITNGDDAVLAGERMVGVGDGVGAWAQKERGHAA